MAKPVAIVHPKSLSAENAPKTTGMISKQMHGSIANSEAIYFARYKAPKPCMRVLSRGM